MIILKTDNGPVVVDPTPAPGRPPKPQFGFTWFGSDGVAWDLVRGPAYILAGARGFGFAQPQHWLRESAGLDGASWDGLRVPPRDVYMPIELESRTDIIGLDRSFFAGMNPRREGRLRVTTPEATWRELTCRYVEGAEGEYDLDPHLRGRAVYPIRMIATEPYWCGQPVELSIRAGEPVDFFPGPPFHIMPGLSLSNAEVKNPGDEPAWPVWRVFGPFQGFTVGIGGSTVAMDVTKGPGEYVEVDMRPERGTFVDQTGADMSAFVTERSFAPIEPGTVLLNVAIEGEGEGSGIELTFTPRYWRAW